MADPYREALQTVIRAVIDGKGDLEPKTRRELIEGSTSAGTLGSFAIKVWENPASIDEEQIQKLRGAGYSEDAIFESIIAAALGAGLERLRRGLEAAGEDVP